MWSQKVQLYFVSCVTDSVINLAFCHLFNTLRPRQNGHYFLDIFKCIFLNENVWILIKISQKFVPKGTINNIPVLVQKMAWRRPGDKPLSEAMVVSLLMPNLMKPDVKSRMKMQLEQRKQALLQLHLSDHQYYCQLRCVSYIRDLTVYLWRCQQSVHIQYIPRNMHTVFALLCFVVVIHGLIFPYPSGLLHWHCGNLTIAPVPAKQSWWIWINTSYEFIMNDCITTTKQSTTKLCAYFLGYPVAVFSDVSSWTLQVRSFVLKPSKVIKVICPGIYFFFLHSHRGNCHMTRDSSTSHMTSVTWYVYHGEILELQYYHLE